MGRDDKKARKRKGSSSSESSVDSVENERRRDLKERDEFATRLKVKDSGATRKVLEVFDELNLQTNIVKNVHFIFNLCEFCL